MSKVQHKKTGMLAQLTRSSKAVLGKEGTDEGGGIQYNTIAAQRKRMWKEGLPARPGYKVCLHKHAVSGSC